MANDYAQLQADVIQYSGRDDVSASVPLFVRLAEPEINRRVRIMEMETRVTFTMSSPDYEDDIPSDWLGFKRLKLDDSPNPKCLYVGPDIFATLEEMSPGNFSQVIGDAALLYTVEARKIRVNRPTGSSEPISVSAVYFARPLALADEDPVNTLNPIIAQHYDLYVYATLAQLWDWVDETEMVAKYVGRMDKVIAQIDDYERMRHRVAGTLKRTNPRLGVV